VEVALRGLSFVEEAEWDEMGQGAAGSSSGDTMRMVSPVMVIRILGLKLKVWVVRSC